jgi:excisionase family DNA binding protein
MTTKPCVETLISIGGAAERLQVSRRTVRRYIEHGHLRGHRDPLSKRVGVELSGVERIAAQRVVITK